MSHHDPSDLSVHSRVAQADALVPAGYAEKTMASLLQLHSELMEEKERRVDLYRRLMEKEQSIAELKMYVKMLEEKVQAQSAPKPEPVVVREAAPVPAPQPVQVAAPVRPPPRPMPRFQSAPIPGPAFGAPRAPKFEDGWKSW